MEAIEHRREEHRVVVSFRMRPEEQELLMKEARETGRTFSDLIRLKLGLEQVGFGLNGKKGGAV